jgi:small subunit ribosomal protein S21
MNLVVEVRDNNVEGALKQFKRLAMKVGLMKEMKKRTFYEKPSLRKKRKRIEAAKRLRKAQRKQADYDRRSSDE